jgi:hypothetical protein
VSVDRKSLRGSAMGGLSPVQMVSAFATGLGSYLLAVKGNQPSLHEALEGAFVGHWDEVHKAVQTGHGRQVFQISTAVAPAKPPRHA